MKNNAFLLPIQEEKIKTIKHTTCKIFQNNGDDQPIDFSKFTILVQYDPANLVVYPRSWIRNQEKEIHVAMWNNRDLLSSLDTYVACYMHSSRKYFLHAAKHTQFNTNPQQNK